MSQFKISVDMADVGAQAGAIINATVLPRLNQAVRAVVTATQARWMEAVQRQQGMWSGEKDAYASSITATMTGDFSGEVVASYKHAQAIENGRPAYDMKKRLDTSLKVRRTKSGQRFLIIPMIHQTPGNTAHAKDMPQEIYEAARNLKPTMITGQAKRDSGEMVSMHPVWGVKRLKKQSPFLSNPATRSAAQVNQNIYKWGEKMAGLAPQHKKFEGMYRMEQSMGGARHSTYMNFRIMGEWQAGKWILPAQPPRPIVQGVVNEMRPLAELAFKEAMKRGG